MERSDTVSANYKVAIIGCGGIARAHAGGYRGIEQCKLVACADIFEESAAKFATEYGIANYYTDYREMMEKERPDIVSICTHHHLHYEMTVAVAAYKPKAIYCEKPIALHLNHADEMIKACEDNGVLLIVGHQRRYGAQYQKAKQLLDEGAIGELVSMDCSGHPWTSLLVDGTHSIDLLRFYNNDTPIDWVIGNVDTKSGSFRFGHPNEGSSISMFGFSNGVRATLTTGGFSKERAPYPAKDAEALGTFVPPHGYHKILLHGTKGRIEIDGDDVVNDQPIVRVHKGEQVEPYPVVIKGYPTIQRVVEHLIQVLEQGGTHLLHAPSARATLEVIDAIFRSSRDRTLVYLPVEPGPNPLYDIIQDQQG
jgi:predicted dehydrogenase